MTLPIDRRSGLVIFLGFVVGAIVVEIVGVVVVVVDVGVVVAPSLTVRMARSHIIQEGSTLTLESLIGYKLKQSSIL